ncbi:MAG: IPT/TIG domain-containing protein [Dysgonomonas sp.]|nr:IPT/TIG domain-containing protein [Dysgonomonas sp.]
MKKYIYHLTIISSILFSFLFVACDESSQIDTNDIKQGVAEPTITSFTPALGAPGTEILLTGTNLSNVDSVYIGDQVVSVKNRVSNTLLLIEVTPNALNGKIKVKNPKGIGESSNNFSVSVVIPTVTEIIPVTEGKLMIGETAKITGENLKSVNRITIDGAEASKVFVSDSEIEFIVPQATIGASVNVIIEYLSGTETEKIESEDKYTILRPTTAPTISACPESGLIYTEIVITGTDLDVADHVILAGEKILFTSQTPTEVKLTIPTSFLTETKTDLILVYNGEEQMVAKANFTVKVPVLSTDVTFYGGVTIYAQDPTTINNFFNAKTGEVYSPCQYASIKNNIYFFINWSDGNATFQLNNPNNSDNSTAMFSCEGTALPKEKMPNIVKFRVLRPDNKNEGPYYTMARERTLGKIDASTISSAGISNASVSTPRFNYNNNPANPFEEGSVIMFQKFDSKGKTVEEVGFIEVIKVVIPEDNKRQASMTFNCFFQK